MIVPNPSFPLLPQPKNAASTTTCQSNVSPGAPSASCSAYPPEPPVFIGAHGVYLLDSTGSQWLDGCAGTFNMSLGYGHPRVTESVLQVLHSGLLHLSSAHINPIVAAAEAALVSVAPNNITHCHLKGATGGSTAIEQAVRHCWVATEKRTVVAFRGGHHGQTIATTAISGMPFRRNRIPSVPLPVLHVPAPDCYRCPVGRTPDACHLECVDLIDAAIKNAPTGEDDVAAFIGEPVLGAGGGITPHKSFWPELHSRLARAGVPLVFDEVQTFGRLGTFFAADYYGVKPDLIALAKGISGIGVPAAGALLMPAAFRSLNSGERSLTWGSSVLTCAAITATIEVMKAPNFFTSAQSVANLIAERLAAMAARFSCIGTVRGHGLMTGLEIVESKLTRKPNRPLTAKILEEATKRHLLLRDSEYGRGSFIKIRPALVITHDEAIELCNRLEEAIGAAI